MYYNENAAEAGHSNAGYTGRDRRALLVGHTVAGGILVRRLDEQGWLVTVVPADRPGQHEWGEPFSVTSRVPPLETVDSNQLGVRALFADGKTAYYDLAVDVTGNRQFLDGHDRRTVAVVPTLGGPSAVDTATTLAAIVALTDALGRTRTVPPALARYREWRENIRPLVRQFD